MVPLNHNLYSPASSSVSPNGASPRRMPTRTESGTSIIQDLRGLGSIDAYMTDSVRALIDVELAVNEVYVQQTLRHPYNLDPRRSSHQPRLSDLPNPFIEIAPRLASRRVRPLVLELIQALGHLVDAVWAQLFTDQPCPWAIDITIDGAQASHPTQPQVAGREEAWRSRMITAVRGGKISGHVRDPPTEIDVSFWEQETRYCLQDVDETVGIYKGAAWAFMLALQSGMYGPIDRGNAILSSGAGGHLLRLLADLEEALW